MQRKESLSWKSPVNLIRVGKLLGGLGVAMLLFACNKQEPRINPHLITNKITSLDDKTLERLVAVDARVADENNGAFKRLFQSEQLATVDTTQSDGEQQLAMLIAYYQAINGEVAAKFDAQGFYLLPQEFDDFEYYSQVCYFAYSTDNASALREVLPEADTKCYIMVHLMLPISNYFTREQVYSLNAYSQKAYMTKEQWQSIITNQAGFIYEEPTPELIEQLNQRIIQEASEE
ncbi:hypothetical protein [Psittacicella gerlachiana]|uniref:Lipoprotein n=1 Tax=Psittacicella gerlachiana TaxID=2028574 RepID=A0A3A1YCA5_9GAMM|nr:hypothetical protein [Psittacicella gerlachiana]RIY34849.1 hypothetical protein CKF59_04630 [Psittacicella gerlachiana]